MDDDLQAEAELLRSNYLFLSYLDAAKQSLSRYSLEEVRDLLALERFPVICAHVETPFQTPCSRSL
jgi:hypothetical protein